MKIYILINYLIKIPSTNLIKFNCFVLVKQSNYFQRQNYSTLKFDEPRNKIIIQFKFIQSALFFYLTSSWFFLC